MEESTVLPYPDGPTWIIVLQANRSWLASVVYARLRDNHAVEVVLQETALAASKQHFVAPDATGICRWLYRVAIRQALLYRRGKQRQEKKQRDSLKYRDAHQIQPSDGDPYRLLIASEQQVLVRKAMTRINARECEILMLKYNEGWSCREIASRLGVSETAMKSRLLRARRQLRTELLNLDKNWDLQ